MKGGDHMYAVFFDRNFDLLCQTREIAIHEMLQIVKAVVRDHKAIGDLTMMSVYEELNKAHLHIAELYFRGGVCNLGHEPYIRSWENFYDIPEIEIYIETEVRNTP